LGSVLEESGAADENSGLFDVLIDQTELGSRTPPANVLDALDGDAITQLNRAASEVKVLGHGHDHLTDTCSRHRGLWSCLAGGSSYSGYGSPSFDRRVRVFSVQDYGETIRTWKLLDGSSRGAQDSHYVPPPPTMTTAPTFADEVAADEALENELEGALEAVEASDEFQAGNPAAEDLAEEIEEAIEEVETVVEVEEELLNYEEEGGIERRQERPSLIRLDEQVLVGRGAPRFIS